MPGIGDVPLEQLRDEWLAHGLSTEPADFDEAERLIADLYTHVGLAAPAEFVRVASPPVALRQLAAYEAVHGLPEPVFVPSTGWQGEYHETRGATWIALSRIPWRTAQQTMWKSVSVETRDALQNALWRPLNDRIVEGVRSPLWHQAAEGVDLTDAATVHRWRGSCKLCGWWWGLERTVIVVDRPSEIGAAIGFRDDWAALLQ